MHQEYALTIFFVICTLSRDGLSQPCALRLKAGEVLITPIIAMPTLYDQERFCQQILYGVAWWWEVQGSSYFSKVIPQVSWFVNKLVIGTWSYHIGFFSIGPAEQLAEWCRQPVLHYFKELHYTTILIKVFNSQELILSK